MECNFNFTAYKNKITSMPEEKKAITVDGVRGYAGGGYFYGEGQPIYTWYMAKYAGVDKETGEALYYKDTDKGETTTTNASEATMHLAVQPCQMHTVVSVQVCHIRDLISQWTSLISWVVRYTILLMHH